MRELARADAARLWCHQARLTRASTSSSAIGRSG